MDKKAEKVGGKLTTEEMSKQIEQLVNKEIEELLIKKEDFITFRDCWLKHPEKEHIIGEAKLFGEVVYRYVS